MILKVAKEKKGITLIALVITIIVLLILAGVTIATLTGENGILTRASETREKANYESAKETIQLAIIAAQINDDLTLDNDTLKSELDAIGASYTSNFSLISYKGYTFSITSLGNVTDQPSNIPLNFKNFPQLKYQVYSTDINFNNFICDDIISEKEKNVTTIYYVDKTHGSDSNNGLSQSNAFKTLKKALASYSSVKSGSVEILVVGETTFYADELYGELISTVPLIIKPLNNTDRITLNGGIQGIIWSKMEGYNNVYKCNTDIQINGVIDCNTKDDYGLYNGLKQVYSLNDCENTVNSFYIDSSDYLTAYVNLEANEPNEKVLPVQKGYLFRFNHTTSTNDCGVYLKNVDTIGISIYTAARANNSSNSGIVEFIADNCTFQHAFTGNLITLGSYDIVYMINCIGGYAFRDIFNYSGSYLSTTKKETSIICEINCKVKEGGFYGNNSLGNNNLSTAHDGLNIVRLNTNGYNSEGPLVADVNGCRSIVIGCKMNNYKKELLGRNCYVFNNVSADNEGLVTFVKSTGSDVRDNSFVLESECEVELVDFTQTDSMNINNYTIKSITDIF